MSDINQGFRLIRTVRVTILQYIGLIEDEKKIDGDCTLHERRLKIQAKPCASQGCSRHA